MLHMTWVMSTCQSHDIVSHDWWVWHVYVIDECPMMDERDMYMWWRTLPSHTRGIYVSQHSYVYVSLIHRIYMWMTDNITSHDSWVHDTHLSHIHDTYHADEVTSLPCIHMKNVCHRTLSTRSHVTPMYTYEKEKKTKSRHSHVYIRKCVSWDTKHTKSRHSHVYTCKIEKKDEVTALPCIHTKMCVMGH